MQIDFVKVPYTTGPNMILPWLAALVITFVQYNQARLHLHKRYLFKN